MGTRDSSAKMKDPEREADRSPPSSFEVKNSGNYTATASSRTLHLHFLPEYCSLPADKRRPAISCSHTSQLTSCCTRTWVRLFNLQTSYLALSEGWSDQSNQRLYCGCGMLGCLTAQALKLCLAAIGTNPLLLLTSPVVCLEDN
jgi:hypothetical protein